MTPGQGRAALHAWPKPASRRAHVCPTRNGTAAMILTPRALRHLIPNWARRAVVSENVQSEAETPIEAMIRQADALRDGQDAVGAAAAYAAASTLDPGRADLRVQQGNMLKDSGELVEAEAAYRVALQMRPEDADTHLQLGHALKLQRRRGAALASYRRAVELNPSLPEAVAELAAMGEAVQQAAAFDVQLRAGGGDALVAMSKTLLAMRSQLDAMLTALPAAAAAVAYPVELYDVLRGAYDVPPAQDQDHGSHVTVVLAVDGASAATLHQQISGYVAQSWPARSLIAVGCGSAAQEIVGRVAVVRPDVSWLEAGSAEQAEAQGVAAAQDGWVVLLASGAVLHPHALGWVAALSRLGPAAFVWDEEFGTPRPGGTVQSDPILRQAVDRDTLLEANIYGGSVAVQRDALTALDLGTAACRTALLLELSHVGTIGHIPLPLTWSQAAAATPTGDDACGRRIVVSGPACHPCTS